MLHYSLSAYIATMAGRNKSKMAAVNKSSTILPLPIWGFVTTGAYLLQRHANPSLQRLKSMDEYYV